MPDRARRVVRTVPAAVPGTSAHPTHSRPLQGLTGPASLGGLLEQLGGWVPVYPPYYPPGIPTRTPVQARTPLPGRVRVRTGTPPDTARTCSFRTLVGEPRGMRTHLNMGPGSSLGPIFTVGLVYTAV